MAGLLPIRINKHLQAVFSFQCPDRRSVPSTLVIEMVSIVKTYLEFMQP